MIENIKLWKHQKLALAREEGLNNFAFFQDPGLGKTLTVITALRRKFNEQRRILPTLILSPKITLYNWKDEWLKFSKIPEERILVLIGDTKKRMEMITKARSKYGDDIICITNYESLVVNKSYFDLLFEWSPVCLVCDESQKVKTHNSKRTKQTTKLSDTSTYRYLLSGTPVLNSPMDIFAQYRILDKGKSFGRNFFHFRNLYFFDKNAGMPKDKYFPDWRIRPRAMEDMNKKIYAIAQRAVKSECLDLPPFIKKKVVVELSPEQRKAYEEMKKHFVTYLEGEAVVAELAITKMLRLAQITTGFANNDLGETISFKKNPRKAALLEVLEEITPGHKVLVWAVFKENYEQVRDVCKKLKIDMVEAHGGISDKDKFAAVDRFNTDPECRVFLGHPGSLGIGINLIPATYSVYYSRTHNADHDVQSEARNYRGGSEIHSSVTRVDIVAEGTIDEIILEALANKMTMSNELLTMIKEKL